MTRRITCSCKTELEAPDGVASLACPSCARHVWTLSVPMTAKPSGAAQPALPDQATCFYHAASASTGYCSECGRFLCDLCLIDLAGRHLCPTCLERSCGADASTALRQQDKLYDTMALWIGWAWVAFWPSVVAALPATIVLHVKYHKAPAHYVIPRRGWRFVVAYFGFLWLPLAMLLMVATVVLQHMLQR